MGIKKNMCPTVAVVTLTFMLSVYSFWNILEHKGKPPLLQERAFCNDGSRFSDWHHVVVWMCGGSAGGSGGAGGSPDLPHLVDWRHGV